MGDVIIYPFKFENWIFAHNGSINRQKTIDNLSQDFKDEIRGETDSEVYFYFLLQKIKEHNDVISSLQQALSEITRFGRYTGLNFLLSDGNNLYAFRHAEKSVSYYTLYLLKRMSQYYMPFETSSEVTRQLLKSKSLNNEDAILICSEKLTDENWIEIENGILIKIDSKLMVQTHKLTL